MKIANNVQIIGHTSKTLLHCAAFYD